jgi:hypothetical protein
VFIQDLSQVSFTEFKSLARSPGKREGSLIRNINANKGNELMKARAVSIEKLQASNAICTFAMR